MSSLFLSMVWPEPDWLRTRLPSPFLRFLLIFPTSVVVIALATWLMTLFLIAEGAITLAAFPLAIAIAGTVYFGPSVALAWGVVVFGAFAIFFGMPSGYSLLYAVIYSGAAWAAAVALHRFGFDRLLSHPVRAVVAWYAIVGVVMPALTTILGVPVLVAGGVASADGGWLLLFISNYISDSFSPVSLGLALCVPIERLTAQNPPVQSETQNRSEMLLWLLFAAASTVGVTIFGKDWLRHGINDMTPAYFLLLAWSALRFSMSFTTIATAAVGLIVVSCHTFGLGGTPIPATTSDTITVYANLLALTVLAQASSAMTSQRRLDHERAVEAELGRARLKRYFSPRIVEDLLAQRDAFDETRAQRAVVMFADIVGFTTLSERQTPEETIAMLREFDTAMEGEIFDNKGVVDKYLGDGVMAAFGLPDTSEVDVASAVRCARGMLERTRQLARKRKEAGEQDYRISIGLHVGDVVAGNVGSERNLSFTVIGDTVNTAARLESLSRDYEAAIVISQDVVDAVRDEMGDEAGTLLADFEKIGAAKVKGRAEAVDVWVLRDKSGR